MLPLNDKIRGKTSVIQEEDYGYVLKNALNEVKHLEKGALYTCIKIMAPEDASKIINHFSINPAGSFYDDLQVVDKTPFLKTVLEKINPTMNIGNILPNDIAKTGANLSRFWDRETSTVLIIAIALVIIGGFFVTSRDSRNNQIKKESRRTKGNKKRKDKGSPNSVEPASSYILHAEKTANLCLIIPCKLITLSLKETIRKKTLNPDEVSDLVGESIYFLVTEDDYMQKLKPNINWEQLPENSDLFVQLCVPGGGSLIGIDLEGSLMRAISAKEEITTKGVGLLNDHNNLEKFNRA